MDVMLVAFENVISFSYNADRRKFAHEASEALESWLTSWIIAEIVFA
jgi:hypothetical protein